MLKLNNLFQDRAVFQRGKSIPVWGKADANVKIRAEFAGQSVFTKSNAEGAFKVRFAAVEAGGPYELKVSVCGTEEAVVVNDILVGDVWLASGQSNMQYPLGAGKEWSVSNAENPETGLHRIQEKEFKDSIKNPSIFRFITVGQNASCIEEETFCGEWKYMTAENAPLCSAAAAWFGKYIQEKIEVPIGLIVSSWGGTIAEAWTSRAGLLANPDTAYLTEVTDAINTDEEIWNMSKEQLTQQVIPAEYADTGNVGFGKGWAECGFDDSAWKTMKVPGSWIYQSISGNGALWVRKEVFIPSDWQGKELVLELGGIDKQDVTYFNGVEVGRTGQGFETQWFDKERNYTIPAELVRAGRNVIAIRAYSFLYDGSLNGKAEFYNLVLKETEQKINLSGDWLAFAEKNMGILAGNAMRLGPCNPNTPSILFNGMIKPLTPYALKGVIWYQGESNAKNIYESRKYLRKLECMVRDWYYAFEQGELPFIQVQLAFFSRGLEEKYNEYSNWAELRDSQRLLCEKMDKVYMASAIDLGHETDIHPQDKKNVGFRLAQQALHNVYCFNDVIPEGPAYKNHIIEGNKVRLFFDNADGMYIKNDVPQSFYIAGVEGRFYPADEAYVDGSSVVVSSNKVKYPVEVSYAWAYVPSNSLYNSADLPASSFKTKK